MATHVLCQRSGQNIGGKGAIVNRYVPDKKAKPTPPFSLLATNAMRLAASITGYGLCVVGSYSAPCLQHLLLPPLGTGACPGHVLGFVHIRHDFLASDDTLSHWLLKNWC